MNLEGKSAIITGAGGGIGRATALELGRGGASLLLVDFDEALLEGSAAACRSAQVEVRTATADVSRSEDVTAYVRAALDAFGSIDVLFNNAGISGPFDVLAEYGEEEFDRVVAVNLRGTFLGLRHVLPVMLEQGSGSVINTSSLAGERGLHSSAAYTASKHGVLGLTRTAAAEVGHAGVRVNAICPGMIDTRMHRAVAEWLMPDDPDRAQAQMARVAPAGRLGKPEEIAAVVRFLASDAASFVNGVAWPVDGGVLGTITGAAPD